MSTGIQAGWGTQWETLANAINDYYGGGVSSTQYQQVVSMLNSGNYTMEEMESIIGNIPEFNRTYNAAGQLTRVSYKATATGNTAAGSIANQINSNAASATQTQFQTVQTITKDAQTGKVTMSSDVKKYNNGTPTVTKTVAGSAVAAVMATSAGINVGKTFDALCYDLGFNWLAWAGVDMESLNPATWGHITEGNNSAGAVLFNYIFDIDPNTGNPQAYMDETTFAYMIAYMIAVGMFDPQHAGEAESDLELVSVDYPIPVDDRAYVSIHSNWDNIDFVLDYWCDGGKSLICYDGMGASYATAFRKLFASANPNALAYLLDSRTGQISPPMEMNASYTYDGRTVYYRTNYSWDEGTVLGYGSHPIMKSGHDTVDDADWGKIAWVMIYGDVVTPPSGIEGITDQVGATVFDSSDIRDPSDIAAVLAALMTQYPELWDNRIEVSPDGENVIKYIPVGFPTGGTGDQPTTHGATQNDLAPDITGDGDNSTSELIKTLIDLLQNPQEQAGMESDTTTPTQPVDPNQSPMGSGTTPVFVIPTGSASALYSVYNPSQSEINSLGAWLWSSAFVDQLLKLFNDPMQAIIGLHKVFATPPTSGTGNIKVGYLNSGVSSKLVSAQYTEIDCGSVTLNEFFKNALDYLKTDIYLYLPFVGIVPLSVEDVTRASVNVKYKVDVLTGACLATVNVTRDAGGGGQLYAYAGNCAVQYPLSSGSYMGIVASALGIAGSVAGTILSGGAMLPMALGVGASALGSARTQVEHSGSLSGNAGAMGIKKPYIIIRRPQTKIATGFEALTGASNNEYGVLGGFSGHTVVKYVHLENIPATSGELTQIEELLKDGVIV